MRYPLDSWDEFKMTITDSTENIFDDLITLTDFPKVDFEKYISENEYVPYTLNDRRVDMHQVIWLMEVPSGKV